MSLRSRRADDMDAITCAPDGATVDDKQDDKVHVAVSQQGALASDPTIEDHHALRMVAVPTGKWLRKYRSVAFQMFVFAFLCFCGPSMDNAIAALGGGGQATPYTANTSASAQYAIAAVVTMLGGPLISRIGIKWACIIGAAGFPLLGTGFYVLSRYGLQWFLIAARCVYGITSSFLYVAEATAMIAYPEENRRGTYLSMWLGARNIGAVISGGISFGLNQSRSSSGAVSINTYLVFLAIQCLGLPGSFFLSQTRKVVRADDYGVLIHPYRSFKHELVELFRHHKQRRTLLMVPVYFFTYFGDGVWFTYLGLRFSVRSRAFSALLAPLLTIVFNFAFGYFILDNRRWGPRKRARIGFFIYMGLSFTMVIWGMVMLKRFEGKPTGYRVDYLDTPGEWFVAYVPFLLYYCFSYSGANLIYWTLGQFASDVASNARAGGVFRSWETVGQAVAYAIDSQPISPWIPLGLVTGLTAIATPCFWLVIKDISVDARVHRIADEDGIIRGNDIAENRGPPA